MKKEHVVIILLVVVVILGVISLILKQKADNLPNDSSGECKTLKYSGKNAINLVFFSNETLSEKNIAYFLSVEPYSKYKELFNIYYIKNYEPECELFKGVALYCSSKELIKRAGVCPNDYIVVLQNAPIRIRSSAYQNVMSINSAHPLTTLLHEFGHSFAGLDDEYIPSERSYNSKNCMSSCEKFGNKKDGCFEGCGDDSYSRSIDNGLMRTLSAKRYGVFNENIIINALDKVKREMLAINAIDEPESCSNNKYYSIEVEYFNSYIKIINKTIEKGCSPKNSMKYDYSADELSGNAKLIFKPELFYTDGLGKSNGPIEGGAKKNDEKSYFFTMPFSEKINKLVVSSEGAKDVELNLDVNINENANNILDSGGAACRIK